MAIPNRVNALVPDSVLSVCITKLKEVNEALAPYLCPISKEEREELFKMGDKSLAFVEKAVEYSQTNPELVPAYLSVSDLKTDFELVKQLQPIVAASGQLFSNASDTVMVGGSEALQQALVFYGSVQTASKDAISNSKLIVADMQKRFERRRKVSTEVEK